MDLGNHHYIRARLFGGYRRAHPGQAGAHDDHIELEPAVNHN
jgi:hypothetical protein